MAGEGTSEKITLEKIDILRSRANVSYRQAYDALQAAGGDVVRALIHLEEQPRSWTERFQVSGAELVTRVRELIREGNVNRITIKHKNRTILDIPVTVGAIGAVLMPYLAALGVIAALATRCTIEVERRPRTLDQPGASPTGPGGAAAGARHGGAGADPAGAAGNPAGTATPRAGDAGYAGYAGAGRVPEAGHTGGAVGTAGEPGVLARGETPGAAVDPAVEALALGPASAREGRLRRSPRRS